MAKKKDKKDKKHKKALTEKTLKKDKKALKQLSDAKKKKNKKQSRIDKEIKYCTCCKKHCPLTSPKCGKGKKLVKALGIR